MLGNAPPHHDTGTAAGRSRPRRYLPRRRPRAWLLASVAAATAVATMTAITPAQSRPAPKTAPVTWGDCPPAAPGIQRDPSQVCGAVTVPLDYRNPSGRAISIAVSRIPARKPAQRRGVLLVNPGGPGAQGQDFASQLVPLLPDRVLDDYDLIGFDPRGVGHSAPVTCGLTADQVLRNNLPYPAPDGSIKANVAFARHAAAGCEAKSGDILPFITTANTARDVDRIRQALSERRISYYGGSYGTYLGAVYASMFDSHVDRMVLDSAVDPAKIWYRQWQLWSVGIADRLPDATGYVAQHAGTLHLGSTTKAARRTYLALARRLDRHPVDVAGSTLDGNLLRILTYKLLYNDAALPALGQLWAAATDFVDGSATEQDTTVVRTVIGAVNEAPSPGVPRDNATAAAYAVVCDDVRWDRHPADYAANVAVSRAVRPASAGMPANIWPCAFWPTRPIEHPVSITSHGRRNILILQNERDPATPLVSGKGIRAALGQRAAFVRVDAGGHGVVVDQNSCANAILDGFLGGGRLPRQDRSCPPS